ncbi:uncharacterized protein LOC106468169 [Limulus polyphemus]|uniref:Uncharacterized protein LOC106468169 n=1 Tax=Limulus polyphemus TaxID=6850 RepID=A0ABM1T8H6_LIMPO|nr:uncharacterized protein LOC106468169 [Limulus polyphemus]
MVITTTPQINSNTVLPSLSTPSPDVPSLPECAPQQVCNAMFLRRNQTQTLCNCPSSFPSPCSASHDHRDGHTVPLVTDKQGQVLTMLKVCDATLTIRICNAPRDWMLLALQSMRTGKAHYLLICQCPTLGGLLGPISHEKPPYANIPGLRVYGMICSQEGRGARKSNNRYPEVPWNRILDFVNNWSIKI